MHLRTIACMYIRTKFFHQAYGSCTNVTHVEDNNFVCSRFKKTNVTHIEDK